MLKRVDTTPKNAVKSNHKAAQVLWEFLNEREEDEDANFETFSLDMLNT